jgi:hypothetical protein
MALAYVKTNKLACPYRPEILSPLPEFECAIGASSISAVGRNGSCRVASDIMVTQPDQE